MNKKLLSLVMSGAMLASACSAGVSAVETKGIKGFAVNAVKFVKNHKPAVAVGGTVIGTTVVAGAIAWLYYHNRDITLTYSDDDDFVSKLANALKAFRNSLRIIGITQDNLEKFVQKIEKAIETANQDPNVSFVKTVENLNDIKIDGTGVIVITKEVTSEDSVTLSAEFEEDNKAEAEEKEK